MEADDQPGLATESPAEACANNEAINTTISAGEPSPSELQPDGVIPEFEAAIKRHAADFGQLAAAILNSRKKFIPESDRKVYEGYIAPLTQAFETAHGPIINSFYCDSVDAAAVLTDRQKFVLIEPSITSGIAPIAELLFECDRLNLEAERILAGPERFKDLQSTKKLMED
jgi:hypothetical protein